MGKAWTKLDLEGGGLQSANLRLAALLRKRVTAYALLALFPLGLHRDYLQDRRGAWLYRAGSLFCIAAWLLHQPAVSGLFFAIMAAAALHDLFRMEDRLARLNKQLRMQIYITQTEGAPPGFKGHYRDDALDEYLQIKDQEHAGGEPQAAPAHGRPSRVPSFAEQEKLLRELAATRHRNGK
jgi:hypothetical protein